MGDLIINMLAGAGIITLILIGVAVHYVIFPEREVSRVE